MTKKSKVFNKVAATLTAAVVIQPGVMAVNQNYLTVLAADQGQTKEIEKTRNVQIIKAGTELAQKVTVELKRDDITTITTTAAVYLNEDIEVKVTEERDIYLVIDDIVGGLSSVKELNVKIKGVDFEINGQVPLKDASNIKDCGWLTEYEGCEHEHYVDEECIHENCDHNKDSDCNYYIVNITANTKESVIESPNGKYILHPFSYKTEVSLKEKNTQTPTDKNEIKLKELKILGEQKVGKTLSAEIKDTNNTIINSGVSYKWYRVDQKNGIDGILVGEGATYTLQSDDEGKYIKLVVSDKNNDTNAISKYTEIIAKDNSQNDTLNKIDLKNLQINGIQKVGSELSAEVKDSNDNVVNSGVSYEWFRTDDTNDTGITSVSKEVSYTLQPSDEGKYIKLVVTNENNKANSISMYTEIIKKDSPVNDNQDKVIISTLEIKGTTKPGNVLSAEIKDTRGNIVNSDVSYRWYRKDRINSISETLVSKDATYTLQAADQGKYIKLLVANKYNSLYTYTVKITKNSSSGGGGGSSSGSSSSGNSIISSTSNTTENSISSENTNTGLTESITNSNINVNNNMEVAIIEKNENGQVQLKTKEGEPATGWQQVDGKWYLGDENGQVKTGWQQTNGKWYLMSNSGEMTTGWQQQNGKWYLMNDSGEMTTGWQQTNGKWYLMNNSGEMTTGWQQQNGKWYLMNNNGEMTTGWQQQNGKWYYLNTDGSMASNTYINGYYVGSDGAWV